MVSQRRAGASQEETVATALPAFEGVHELARGVEAFPHERGLLPHCHEGILEQAGLVLGQRRRRHGGRGRSRRGLGSGGVARTTGRGGRDCAGLCV